MGLTKDLNAMSAEDIDINKTFHINPEPDDVCFLCGEPVRHPAAYWSGHHKNNGSNVIHLHPTCALSLAHGLLNDGLTFIYWEKEG